MATSTRNRILETTAELFRRHGYTGTGMKQIVAAANAPFGSLYHHFPGGKEQLGGEVIRTSGAMYAELFADIAAEAGDPISYIEDVFTGAAATLVESDYADACPIATVALEVASTNEPLREATAEVFQGWIDGLSKYLVLRAGIEREDARRLAFEILSLLEGAFVFSRAMRSPEPVHIAGANAVARVREALP